MTLSRQETIERLEEIVESFDELRDKYQRQCDHYDSVEDFASASVADTRAGAYGLSTLTVAELLKDLKEGLDE